MSSASSSADEPQPISLVGQAIEGYRIERVLGHGGMGVVYAARHIELDSMAALKMLLPARNLSSSQDALARFLNEARALSRVSDEGLVKIFNFGHLPDRTPYIIMELLSGQTLGQRLQECSEGRLPAQEALTIVEQAAVTLAVLHENGVIHRDLKPENLMLVPDPFAPGGIRVKLLDFGIAKLVQPMEPTLTHEPLGTPLYMSPEVCRNEAVTGKADVYALGCVFYKMLCGRTPYLSEDGSSLLVKHMFNTPEPPRSIVRGLPEGADALVMQMLVRDPGPRPTMLEVAGHAQKLRLHPRGLYWVRVRWGLSRLWRKRLGKILAYLLAMPIFISLLLLILALVSVNRPPWMDRLTDTLLFWRTSLVRIPAGHFTTGSTDEELAIARELVDQYAAQLPEEARLYKLKYLESESNYFSREQPTSEVDMVALDIDRYEATNEQFVDFLNDQLKANRIIIKAKCPEQDNPEKHVYKHQCVYLSNSQFLYKHLINDPIYGGIKVEQGHFTVDKAYRRHPVVAMTWQAANDYCQWRHGPHGRLPTELEWEYVARRGGRRFPWGDELPGCQHAVLERCGKKREFCGCKVQDTQAILPDVGSTPQDRSMDGVMDLGGSVSEWTSDWFHAQLPASMKLRADLAKTPSQISDEQDARMIRGGAWTLDFLSARSTSRVASRVDQAWDDVGVRCVRDVTP